ncbi:MAG: hypothetical protein GY797_12370 [Deltaproteobacteria bacterium]|nr:hypothetical protein [Deltaproteobacteria bacterium]
MNTENGNATETEEFESESLHPDDIVEQLTADESELKAFMSNKKALVQQSIAKVLGLGDIDYPYTCYRVQGQSDSACKLTAPQDLPSSIRDIYKIDSGLANVYSRKDTLLIGVQACVWSHFGKSGSATVSGMSSMRFDRTRPSSPTSQHNQGRAFDVKLQGRMMSNGSSYDQMACAYLCLYCVNAGATRVIFSDQAVVDAVNKTTGKKVCIRLDNHRNHVHMDNR